ncbi:MAG: hypothetical protein RSH78_00160 [Bacilli bacterium]|uniref:hypothetical protein n=1 Tax=Clostridium sp. TaxID=1506 RepID=UPI002FC77B26
MALYKEGYENQYGVLCEYWRIINININLQYKFCDITLGGYHTKETRFEDKEPMEIRKVRAKWAEDEFEQYFSPKAISVFSIEENPTNIYNNAYEYVKKDDFFNDSKNI